MLMDLETVIENKAQFVLVGTETIMERDAMSEAWHVLIKFGDLTPLDVFELPIRGLFLIALEESAEKAIKIIINSVKKHNFEFLYCKTFTPLEKIIPSNKDIILETISKLFQKIPSEKSWRITLSRRHTRIRRKKLIDDIAALPTAPKADVDLENPDWEVIVEIMGEWTGLGVYQTPVSFSYVKASR
jgi:tRNA(Ser,Leu) C12 N-acetylase TAN1